MLGAVQVFLDCPDQAAATRVRDAINNYLAGLPAAAAWKHEPAVDHPKGTRFRVNAGAWYVDEQQAINVYNRVQVLWAGSFAADILSGSQVRWHECREDEGIYDCSNAPGASVVKP